MKTQIMKLNYYGTHFTITKEDEQYIVRVKWTEYDGVTTHKKSRTLLKRSTIHDCLAFITGRCYS